MSVSQTVAKQSVAKAFLTSVLYNAMERAVHGFSAERHAVNGVEPRKIDSGSLRLQWMSRDKWGWEALPIEAQNGIILVDFHGDNLQL